MLLKLLLREDLSILSDKELEDITNQIPSSTRNLLDRKPNFPHLSYCELRHRHNFTQKAAATAILAHRLLQERNS